MNKHILALLIASVMANLTTMSLSMLYTDGVRDMNSIGEGWLEVFTTAIIVIFGWMELLKLLKEQQPTTEKTISIHRLNTKNKTGL